MKSPPYPIDRSCRVPPRRATLGRTFLCCCALGLLHASVIPGGGGAASTPAKPFPATVFRARSAEPSVPGEKRSVDDVQGLQTSLRELEDIRELAQKGVQPHRDNVDKLVDIAGGGWTHGKVGVRFTGRIIGSGTYDKICERTLDPTDKAILPDAGQTLYALVLAHFLTRREAYAREARAALLDFADSSGFDKVEGARSYTGANKCALELSLLAPLLIDSALLLEGYPDWGTADRDRLREWLATEVYPITSAIARTRKNNWGTAAAFASWSIGHYLSGSDRVLEEIHPAPLVLTPEEAMESHLQSQLDIVGNDWQGDSRCERFGIQSHGGFPDELRRGSTGCTGDHLLDDDASYSYQIMTTSHLIYHAEALRRHGGNELYTYRSDVGQPMLLEAIAFVVDNPRGKPHDWKSTDLGVLRVANEFYGDERLCEQIRKGFRFIEGRYLPFARLTHPYGCG